MMEKPSARHAYVQAEVVTALAHQIRAIRNQRGWTQRELAKRLGTTQAAVSRLEDPSYGRLSVQTLIELSRTFDTGLQIRFVSMIDMLKSTWKPSARDRCVPSFEEEAPLVSFAPTSTALVDTIVKFEVPAQQSIATARVIRFDTGRAAEPKHFPAMLLSLKVEPK